MRFKNFVLGTALAGTLILSVHTSLAQTMGQGQMPVIRTSMASHIMPLDDRYAVPSVNKVFRDNILLTLAYMREVQKKGNPVDWTAVEKPFTYSLTLQPGQNFAFHDAVLPQFQGKITITTHADFASDQGFQSDGYLVGDGVCHLASFMNWVAKDAGVTTVALVNHNFARIPDIARQYGVAIYDDPNSPSASEMQNLYITNNKNYPITFTFTFQYNELTLTIHSDK